MTPVPESQAELRFWLLPLLVVPFLLCPFSRLLAADYEQKQGPARLRLEGVKIEKQHAEMRLSDELRLSFEVEGPAGMEVQPLQNPISGKDWQVTAKSPPSTTTLAEERVRWQQTFHLRPMRPGEVPLAVSDLRYRDKPQENWQEIHWSLLPAVQVSTEILKPETSELRGITGPELVPPAPSWWPLVAWVGAALTGLALFLAGWSVWRRRGSTPVALAPDQWALQEIDRIASWPRTSDAEVERFYTALCDVVRKYLELRYQLPALEQTTTEFFETLRTSPQLSAEHHELLRRFLQRCDLVKFARAASSPEECQEMVTTARNLIS